MAKKLSAVEQQEFDLLKARLERMGERVSPNIGLDALRAKVKATLNDEGSEESEEDFEEELEDENESEEGEFEDDLADLDEDDTENTLLDDDELDDSFVQTEVDLTSQLNNVTLEVSKKTSINIKPVKASDALKLLAIKGSADDGKLSPLELSQALAKTPKHVKQQVLKKSANRLIRIKYTNLNPQKAKWPGEYLTTGNSIIGRVTKFIPFDEASQQGYMVPYALYELMRDKTFYSPKVTNQNNKTTKVVDMNPKEYSIEILPMLTEKELNKIAQRQASQGKD